MHRRPSAPRRLVSGLTRVAAIVLTVRSQARAALAVAPPADVIHGMAYMGIPVALGLGRRTGARVVYDARDIYTDANNLARLPRPARLLLGRIERRWARRADRVVTVNRPYADVMAERFGVPRPAIVMNCSYRYEPPDPAPRRFHDRLGLDAATGIVLYQGGFSRERGIEQLIDAIASVPDALLVLMGYGPLQAELEARAADPSSGGRIRILPAIPPTELLDWVASADVIAMPIQPSTLNHRLTTPNKLFEAMAAGVPVVASDLPGMADIVRETGCGILVDPTDPSAIAAAIREILEAPEDERRAWRARALAAAHHTYDWERQMEVLLDEYTALTRRRW
jgi:glycosyltransferase involved in cell wall biosynthesis